MARRYGFYLRVVSGRIYIINIIYYLKTLAILGHKVN